MAEKIENPLEDVHNDVREAIKQLSADAPAETAAQEVEHPEPVEQEAAPEVTEQIEAKADHPTDANRYADGTFKPSKTEAAPKEAAPVTEKLPSTDDQTKVTAPVSNQSAPPAGWTAAEKAEWSKLPPAVQAAVSRREAEISRGGQQWSEEKRRYESVLAPLVQETRRLGISPDQGLNALLTAHHRLNQNPAQAIAELAQQFGVDLANLSQNPPAPQPQPVSVDPQVYQHIHGLQSQLDQLLTAQTAGLLQAFAADKAHPHYEKVRARMGQIFPQLAGTMSDEEALQQAYDQAVWLDPDIREQLIAERQASAQQAQIASIQTKQKQATKAAVSIRGSSNGASPPPKTGATGGDVYDDVRAAIHQLRQ